MGIQYAGPPRVDARLASLRYSLRAAAPLYKENFSPPEPIPSFKHVLMWALQSGEYEINFSFFFSKQVSWASAEAAWRLRLDPQEAAPNCGIVRSAMVDTGIRPDQRHTPGSWAEDGYDTDEYDTLRVRTMQQREEDNDARVQAMLDDDAANAAANPQRQPGVRGAVTVPAENPPA